MPESEQPVFFNSEQNQPLADRMRPQTLDEVLGQSRILGENSMLRKSIESGRIPSMIFWGPPGCGKTSLANVIKKQVNRRFFTLSAVSAGVKDVKTLINTSRDYRKIDGDSSILFIDEIHRFNKAQQDALLQAVEDGTITLIGATTENPSFEVNNALLSRCQLILFAPLSPEALKEMLLDVLQTHPRGLKRPDVEFSEDAMEKLVAQADGDARFLLNQLEWISQNLEHRKLVDTEFLDLIHYEKPLRYDKNNDDHYNLISAFHKSIRGSDPDAALYWLHRMIQGGEDPRYLLRRMMRMACEDVGLADPQAVVQASACRETWDFLGAPEGLLALDQLAVYLACAPKSNALEKAWFAVEDAVRQHGTLPVPRAFRNAVNKTGKSLGYGKDYAYDHDSPHAYSAQEHLPEKLKGTRFYEPTSYGHENVIKERLEFLQTLARERKLASNDDQ